MNSANPASASPIVTAAMVGSASAALVASSSGRKPASIAPATWNAAFDPASAERSWTCGDNSSPTEE